MFEGVVLVATRKSGNNNQEKRAMWYIAKAEQMNHCVISYVKNGKSAFLLCIRLRYCVTHRHEKVNPQYKQQSEKNCLHIYVVMTICLLLSY